MDILQMPVTSESTPVFDLEVVTAATPQPAGRFLHYEAQVMHVENGSCHTSISSLDLIVHEYLKNHFNELLNDKVYNTFKELF